MLKINYEELKKKKVSEYNNTKRQIHGNLINIMLIIRFKLCKDDSVKIYLNYFSVQIKKKLDRNK